MTKLLTYPGAKIFVLTSLGQPLLYEELQKFYKILQEDTEIS